MLSNSCNFSQNLTIQMAIGFSHYFTIWQIASRLKRRIFGSGIIASHQACKDFAFSCDDDGDWDREKKRERKLNRKFLEQVDSKSTFYYIERMACTLKVSIFFIVCVASVLSARKKCASKWKLKKERIRIKWRNMIGKRRKGRKKVKNWRIYEISKRKFSFYSFTISRLNEFPPQMTMESTSYDRCTS